MINSEKLWVMNQEKQNGAASWRTGNPARHLLLSKREAAVGFLRRKVPQTDPCFRKITASEVRDLACRRLEASDVLQLFCEWL